MTHMSGEEVGALVRSAAAGNAQAWNDLVDRFANLVWAVTRSFRLDSSDAADVSQVAWLRLVEHLDRLTEPDRVGAWLGTTVRRECLAVIRRRNRAAVPSGDDATFERLVGEGPAPEHRMLAEERNAVIWKAMEGISERCRQLLRILMADPPPSYEEVGAALEMPIGSIGPTRARCLAQLRRRLSEGGISPEALRSVE
jgi:RNA polymerase sigma factor (sigma-70 family)